MYCVFTLFMPVNLLVSLYLFVSFVFWPFGFIFSLNSFIFSLSLYLFLSQFSSLYLLFTFPQFSLLFPPLHSCPLSSDSFLHTLSFSCFHYHLIDPSSCFFKFTSPSFISFLVLIVLHWFLASFSLLCPLLSPCQNFCVLFYLQSL